MTIRMDVNGKKIALARQSLAPCKSKHFVKIKTAAHSWRPVMEQPGSARNAKQKKNVIFKKAAHGAENLNRET